MLGKISNAVLKYKKVILFVMAVLFAVSVVGTVFLVLNKDKKINSDVASYLDENSDSARGIAFLRDYFDVRGYATMVVRVDENVGGRQTLREKIDELKKNERITSITWDGTMDVADRTSDSVNDLIDLINSDDNKTFLTEILTKFRENELVMTTNAEVVEGVSLLLDYASEENKDVIDTTPMRTFLRRETATEGVYDYVVLFMLKTDGVTEASYELLDEIKSAFSYTAYASSGSVESGQRLLNDTMRDLPWFIVAGVIIVLVILFLTTSSYLEPFIMLTTLIVGIVISMGINYLFPSISIISFAISSVLQLAITMDYAVFYTHLYRARRKTLSSEEATKAALPEAAESIIAGALTTVGGFAALYCMRFRIGADVANVLIKGVVLSMLTVLTVQPILTFMLDSAIQKTTHRFTEKIAKKGLKPQKGMIAKPVAKFSVRARIVLCVVALALIVPCFIGQMNLRYSYLKLYESKTDTEEEILSEQIGNQLIIAVPYDVAKSGKTHRDFAAEVVAKGNGRVGSVLSLFTVSDIDEDVMKLLLDQEGKDIKLSEIKDGLSVLTATCDEVSQEEAERLDALVDEAMPVLQQIEAGLVAGNSSYLAKTKTGWYTLYAIAFTGDSEDEEAQDAYASIMSLCDAYFGKENCHAIGMVISGNDMADITPSDFLRVTLVSVAIIFVIVTLLLRNPLKSFFAVLLIELGIWLNLSISYLSGESVNFIVYIIISSVELGCTVDYAILFANTFEKNRKASKDGKECARLSAEQSMPAVFCSALLISMVCLSMYLISGNIVIKQLAGVLARGAAISFVLVAVFMPAIWSFFPVAKKTVDYKKKMEEIDKKLEESKE